MLKNLKISLMEEPIRLTPNFHMPQLFFKQVIIHKKFQSQDSLLLQQPLPLMLTKRVLMEKRKLSKLKNLKNLLILKLISLTPDFHMLQLFFN